MVCAALPATPDVFLLDAVSPALDAVSTRS
jgi:ABC-type phosphate transport system ATPase subunit